MITFFRWDHKKSQSHKVPFTAAKSLKSCFHLIPLQGSASGMSGGWLESGFTLILSAWIIHLAKKMSVTRCISYVIKCLWNFTIVKTHCELTDPHHTWRNNSLRKKIVVWRLKKIFAQGNCCRYTMTKIEIMP